MSRVLSLTTRVKRKTWSGVISKERIRRETSIYGGDQVGGGRTMCCTDRVSILNTYPIKEKYSLHSEKTDVSGLR